MNAERINTEAPSNHGFRCHKEGCFFKCASREDIKDHLKTANDAQTNRMRQSKKKDTKNEFNKHQRGHRNTIYVEAFYEGHRGRRGQIAISPSSPNDDSSSSSRASSVATDNRDNRKKRKH